MAELNKNHNQPSAAKEQSQSQTPTVAKLSDTSKKSAKSKTSKAAEHKVISEVTARANYIKISPRKVRLVIDQIRGLGVEAATDRLNFIRKDAVKPIAKLLNSAIANAQNNFEIDKKHLFVKKITADDGPIIKRYRPRAHGSSAMLRKRMSDIKLTLGVKAEAVKKVVKKSDSKEDVKVISHEDIKKDQDHNHDDSSKPGSSIGKSEKGFMKGVFQRKTG